MIVLFYPGQVVGPFDLNDMLGEIHNDERIAVIAELARRKANGAPADGLKEIGPFERRAHLEGLKVTARTISAKKMRVLDARHLAALERYRVADTTPIAGEDDVSRAARLAEIANGIYEAKAAYVASIIVEVDGFVGAGGERVIVVAGEDGMPAETIEAFDEAHLLLVLFTVAIYAQRLPTKKASRSGQSHA